MRRGVKRTPESARAYMHHVQTIARNELYKQAGKLKAWEVQQVSQVLFMDGMTTWHGASPPRMESFHGGLLEIKLLIPLVVPSMEKLYKSLDYGAAYGQNPLIPGCKELSAATKFAIQYVDIFAASVSKEQRKNIVREMQMTHGVPFRTLELINAAYQDVGASLRRTAARCKLSPINFFAIISPILRGHYRDFSVLATMHVRVYGHAPGPVYRHCQGTT